MKNKFIIVYTVFTSLVFVFAISFFGFNLYKEYSYGNSRTTKKYETIINSVKSGSKESNLQSVLNKVNENLTNFNDFSYISIKLDGTEIYSYPVNLSKQETVSNLTKNYETTVRTDLGTFKIDCNLYLLRPASIYYYAKISFLIVLIITIITIVLIIYLNLTTEVTSSQVILHEETSVPETVETIEESPSETVIETTETSESEQTVETKTTSEEPVLSTVEPEKIEPTPVAPSVEKVELPSEEEKPVALTITTPSENQDTDNPAGLFNPETGFGWESYLITRLDSEIDRAIASEIDIALFVIQLPGLSRDSVLIKNVCNYLAIQFQFKDLLFEYKDDCLVAMKISMDIDEALNLSDKLYADIKNIIEENECFIGISSRSIRMVSGERLLHEAEEAVIHAKDDKDSPIIAFRVDAEKYRQFLEQNNN